MTLLAHRYAAGMISSDAEPKRVLMILFRKYVHCEIFIIDGQETQRLRQRLDWKEIHQTVRTILEDENIRSFDLCILDGVRQALDECGQLMVRLGSYTGESKKIQRVVYTTSLQFQFKMGDMPVGRDRVYEQINFDSFTEDDYLSAIANREFLERLLGYRRPFMADILHLKENGKIKLQDQDDNNEDPYSDLTVDAFLRNDKNFAAASEYIKEKFFYAGGSARFMFELTTPELIETLGDLFMQLGRNDWDAFANSALAPSAPHAVNTLMQQFKGYSTAVSRYVLFEAYDRVEGKLVKAVQISAEKSQNPALKGWAFELRQLQTIKTVLTNNSQHNCPKRSLRSTGGFLFRPVKNGEASFDGNQLTNDEKVDLKSGTIIWCTKWNQRCFDVAFFKKHTLMTLQFTNAETHTIKIQFIKDLRNAIEKHRGVLVNHFIHVGLVG
eukprot:scaffold14568_cov67-Cylindrotheca_fusiformis.AAC.1